LQAGANVKTVSERLGHASAAFTLDVYGHIMPGMQEETTDIFSKLLYEDGKKEVAVN
jgi:integrase